MNPGTINVQHDERDSFSITIRGHDLVVDQPLEDGGRDSGPTPTELFVASIAGCVAHYARRFLERHGLPDDVHVSADWTITTKPHTRVGEVVLTVETADLPLDLAPRFERTVSHCLVHNSLMDPPVVTIQRKASARRRAS